MEDNSLNPPIPPIEPKTPDRETFLMDQIIKLNSKLASLENQNKQAQQERPIPQDNLTFYERPQHQAPIANTEDDEETTLGELRAAERERLQREWQQFLYDQKFGNNTIREYNYGNNPNYYMAGAILDHYSRGDERMKKIMERGNAIKYIAEFDYVKATEMAMNNYYLMDKIYEEQCGEERPFYNSKFQAFKNAVGALNPRGYR